MMTREEALQKFIQATQSEIEKQGIDARVTFRKDHDGGEKGSIAVGITNGEKRRAMAVNPPFESAHFVAFAVSLCELFDQDKAAA